MALFLVLTPSQTARAESMEIATDSNFANQTKNFSAGQTVFVRIQANSPGNNKRELNVRDNSYNLLKTYPLNKISDNPYKFTASFQAPSQEGLYSLEANIQSVGSNTVSVKTINVGNSNNSSVKVNITEHTSVEGSSDDEDVVQEQRSNQETEVSTQSNQDVEMPTQEPSVAVQISQDQEKNKSIFAKIGTFFKNMWLSIKLFR